MLRPLISENVRSTARRSAPWKSRLTGCPSTPRVGAPRPGSASAPAPAAGRSGLRTARSSARRVSQPPPRHAHRRREIRRPAPTVAATGLTVAASLRGPASRPAPPRDAGGSDERAPAAADGLSKSTTTVLRSLRTWCATGCGERDADARGRRAERLGGLDGHAGDRAALDRVERPGQLETSSLPTLRKSRSTRQRIGPRRHVRHRLGRLDDERRALARARAR